MLIHEDGLDFTLLEPVELAVALFIALPALFGVLLTYTVDRVARPDSATAVGRRRWWVPLLVLVPVLPAVVVILPVAVVIGALLPLRRGLLQPLRHSPRRHLGGPRRVRRHPGPGGDRVGQGPAKRCSATRQSVGFRTPTGPPPPGRLTPKGQGLDGMTSCWVARVIAT